MGVKGIFRFILRRLLEATIVIGLITFLPNLPPYAKFSDSIRLPPSKPLEGKLALNEKLKNVEIWHKGDLLGPEAFADFNGELYTSVYGGDIVKLTGSDIKLVAKTGKPCKGFHEERICGRPLGMQFNKNGDLFVADAYYGIMKVDVKSGQKQVIISPDQEIGGRKSKLFNSIALAANGDIYWTDSSEINLENGVFGMLADPSGRLIHYDAKTKQNRVLIDKLHFANGVLLSDDEEFVLAAETGGSRVYRYYLKGLKKGTHDVFIDGLPGLPDNLKSDGQGGVLVTLIRPSGGDTPSLSQVLLPFPLMRKFVARVFGIIELGFETLNNFYPCEFAQKAVHTIGHFTTLPHILEPTRTVVIRLSRNGDILENLSTTNKNLKDFCEAHIFNNNIYLGSPFNDFIGRIPLSEVGWEHLDQRRVKRDVPVVQPKIETASTTTKPTVKPVTKQQSPPPKQQTPLPKQQTTPPPPAKQQQTTPQPKQPSPTQQQTTPPTPKQQTPPKQQTASPTKQQTAPAPKQQTAPPPKQQTAPPPKQQTAPPPKQQTAPPTKQQTAPPTKQQTAPPTKQQTTPPPEQQTAPPPKQQTAPPPKQQTAPPPKQQTAPPTKQQTAPTTKQQTAPPPKQQTAPPPKQQTAPPPKQQTAPPLKVPPTKQADKEELKAVPVKESTKSTNRR